MQQFLSGIRRAGTAVAIALALLVLFQATGLAQMTGTVTGTVVDSSGAVVPSATIVLKNDATSDTRNTVSNGVGYFTFAAVLPGTYTVRIDSKGFKPWEAAKVILRPGDKINISEISLQVATSDETVTVDATTEAVRIIDSGERSSTLFAKQIDKLALQGRDVTELLKTLPGFNYATSIPGSGIGAIGNASSYNANVVGVGSAVGNGFNANGMNRGGVDLVADGAHIIDPGCNCNATATINGDMVSEVKVQSSNFGADTNNGPVVVNAVSKSGGSQFHGEAYLHVRDSSMNSTDWNLNASGQKKPEDRYWYPGGQFSGPVRIPGTDFNKGNKLFFFTAYEYYKQRYPDQLLEAYVPTLGMRQGDFSATGEGNAEYCSTPGWHPECSLSGSMPDVANPGAYVAVPSDGILPSSVFDPGGLAIMSMIPEPNADPTANAGGFNYIFQPQVNKNGGMFKTKIDYNLNDNNKFTFSYNLQRETGDVPVMQFWQPPKSVPYAGQMQQKPISHTFSVNYVKVFSPTLTNEFIGSIAYLNDKLIYGNPDAVSRSAQGYPYQGVFKNGSDTMPAISNGWWIPGYPMIYQNYANGYSSKKFLPIVSDNLSKVFGTHSFKTGFYYETTGNNQTSTGYTNGMMEFAPDWGGSMATGNPVANILLGAPSNYTEINFNPRADLAYKTISFYFQDNWKVTSRLSLDLGVRFEHAGAWTDNQDNGFAVFTQAKYEADVAAGVTELPGMDWHGKNSAISLSGRDVKPIFVSPRIGLAFDVFGTGRTVFRGGWGAYRWRDSSDDQAYLTAAGQRSFTTNYTMRYLSQIDAIANATGSLTSGANALDPTDDQQPVTYSYNFTWSQKLPWDMLLETGYVGNQSNHLATGGRLADLNIIPLGALFQPDPVTGAPADPEHADTSHYRPYPAYANGSLRVLRHDNYMNYNGLQVSLSRQKGAAIYGINYTFSKALGILGEDIPDSIDANYGVLNSDRTHVLSANYSVDLPNIRGTNAVVRAITNGWTISGITSVQSGQNMQSAYGRGFGLGADTASGLASLNNKTVLGTPDYTVRPMLLCDPSSGIYGAHQFINPACFAPPADGENGPMNIPYIHGPKFFNSDLSVQKTVTINERQKVEFRASAFNFLNHALWSFDPNNTKNIALQYKADADGNPVLTYGDGWGITNTKFGRRVVELSLKYKF